MSIVPRRLRRVPGLALRRAGTLVRIRCSVCARDLSVWNDIRAVPPLAVWGGVLCVALMLVVRRIAAPASLKLSTMQLGVTATIAGGLTVASRLLLARLEIRPPAQRLRVACSVAAALPVLTLVAGSSRPLSPAGLGYILGVGALSAGLAWLASRELLERLASVLTARDDNLTAPNHHSIAAPLPTARLELPRAQPSPNRMAALSLEGGESCAPAQVGHPAATGVLPSGRAVASLRLERISDPVEGERLQGSVVAEFAAGQGLSTVHVAFQPQFHVVPQVDCELDKAAAARVKAVSIFPYGARLELKRTGDLAAPARFEIRFCARLKVAAPRAA